MKAAPPGAKSGLFADEDEEDDMFAATEPKTSSSKKRVSVPECVVIELKLVVRDPSFHNFSQFCLPSPRFPIFF